MVFDPSGLASFLAQGIFYILLLIFTLHAVFVGYHWFTYGTNKSRSLIALAVYLGGGAILLLTIALTMSLI